MSSTVDQALSGVLPVVQTPFAADLQIDRATLKREIDWAFELGADGVVVAMVSEILRLGNQQRRELAALVCEMVARRGFTVISVGAETTSEAIELAQHAEGLGATAVMAIPPVKQSLHIEETVNYFAGIANCVSIPLVVQDASSYVGAAIDSSV
jgi:2-keto-3-deoxy-L-arabinonate dehydratase